MMGTVETQSWLAWANVLFLHVGVRGPEATGILQKFSERMALMHLMWVSQAASSQLAAKRGA
jgi:hypothetical protein